MRMSMLRPGSPGLTSPMKTSNALIAIAAAVVALASCGGQTEDDHIADAAVDRSSTDASPLVDANDAARDPAAESIRDTAPDPCPNMKPAENYACDTLVATRCTYGAATCTCRNLGQNSAAWTCSQADSGDAEAGAEECTYDDGGAVFDGSSRFGGVCPDGGCPTGTICAVEVGGVAGGGGEYCAPIPDRCSSNPTCACLGLCVCGERFGRPERCTDGPDGTIYCDDGIR